MLIYVQPKNVVLHKKPPLFGKMYPIKLTLKKSLSIGYNLYQAEAFLLPIFVWMLLKLGLAAG